METTETTETMETMEGLVSVGTIEPVSACTNDPVSACTDEGVPAQPCAYNCFAMFCIILQHVSSPCHSSAGWAFHFRDLFIKLCKTHTCFLDLLRVLKLRMFHSQSFKGKQCEAHHTVNSLHLSVKGASTKHIKVQQNTTDRNCTWLPACAKASAQRGFNDCGSKAIHRRADSKAASHSLGEHKQCNFHKQTGTDSCKQGTNTSKYNQLPANKSCSMAKRKICYTLLYPVIMRIYMHLCQVSFIIIRHVLTISVVYKGKSTQKNNKLCDIQSPQLIALSRSIFALLYTAHEV